MKSLRQFFSPTPVLAAFALICSLASAQAQVTTLGWNFGTGTANAQPSSGTPSNFIVGAFGIGNTFGTDSTPINTTSASNTYTGASGSDNIGNAVNIGALNTGTSAYYTVTFTPSSGYSLQITGFNFGTRSTATGPQAYALYSSADNYTAPLFTGTISNNSVWAFMSSPAFTLNGAAGAPVTLRLYTYGGAGNAGSGSVNSRVDDVAITVAAVAATQQTNPTAVASAGATAVPPGGSVTLSVVVTPGTNPASSGLAVTGDLSAIGGSAATPFTAGANDTFTYTATVPANATFGAKALNFSVTDAQSRTATASLTLNVLGDLTIFHTNDTHARVTPHMWVIPQHTANPVTQFQPVGGAAYMAGEMLSLVTGAPDALVLDGGDISEGNPVGDWNGPGNPTGSYGNGTSVAFYQLYDTKLRAVPGRGGRGLDAMVVGNHDIRDISYLNNLKNQSNFPVISINICQKGTQTAYFQPYVIVNVNGSKIGIVGYTTETSDSPEAAVNNAIDVVHCDWSSSDSTKIHFANVVNDLRNNQGCNLVILLTHDGHSDLCEPTTSSPVTTPILVDNAVAKIPEVAITGHWHTWAGSVWQPAILNYKTIFAEAGSFNHYVGELRVNGAGQYISSANHVLDNSTITPDPDIANFVRTRINQFNAQVVQDQANNPGQSYYTSDQVLGYTADALLLDNYMKWWSADEYPWSGNNTAGNWISDGIQWKATQLFGQCDLSLESGGGVRSDIAPGPVTYTNVYETYPWADDTIWMVKMTGQDIWNYIQGHGCDVGISQNWFVTANDGKPTSITYNGQPVNLTATYKVAITNYMYMHDSVPFTDPSPQETTFLARTALAQFTSQFTQSYPYQAGGSRYNLNTEYSGGYQAVVTMLNDADSSYSFDDAFIRILKATPETLGHLGTKQVPTSLVNSDGTVNQSNRLAESEMYRSYLGFKTGMLHPGDIIQTYGKGSFYNGDPEFVDQEGIQSDGVELQIVGHDPTLAQPAYVSSINGFLDDFHKNHYVKFVAKKSGTNQVTDQNGTTLTVEDVTAFTAKTLPGNVGDLLLLTGVPTSEYYALRFRCDSAVLASSAGISNYPPSSSVNAVPSVQTSSPLTLTAVASAAPSSSNNTYTLSAVADSQVESGTPTTNYGAKTFLFVQSSSVSTFGNERSWLRFDLSSIPAGSNITSAKLNLFCWSATGASLPTAVCGGNDDTWTDAGITWNTQPTFGNALDTQTLASGATSAWYSWDVTSFAQSKFAGNQLFSVVAKPVTEGSTDATAPGYGFESHEYTSNTPYLQVTVPISGYTPATVTQVQYFYRYSSDNATWGAWSLFQTTTAAPWTATFTYPNGYGYYQFYSIATDSNGTVEPAPPFAEAAVQYTNSSTPAIAVQQPSGTSLESAAATVKFGTAVLNTGNASTFVVANNGAGALTGIALSIDGTNASDFSVTTAPSTAVGAGTSSTFVVGFAPTASGYRSAVLHIASNDPTTNPFNINLTGVGISITNSATAVNSQGGTLQGTFNPGGVDAMGYFQYGTTTGYGSTTATQDLGAGGAPVNFSTLLSGLAPGTTYYVQAVIVSGGVTTYGAPQTFTTPAIVPALANWGWMVLGGILLVVGVRCLPRRRTDSAN